MEQYASFSVLHKKIKGAGLLRKRSRYYDMVVIRNLCMLAVIVSAAAVIASHTNVFLWQIPVAIALGFTFGQIGFFAHDSGHGQVSSAIFPQVFLSHFSNCFIYGALRSWQIDHDKHHAQPNDTANDPDCNIIFSFTEEQARARKGILRFVAKYQAFFFLPFSCFTGVSLRLSSTSRLFSGIVPHPAREAVLLAASLASYIVGMTFILGLGKALLFLSIAELTFGLYMGLAFTTNHRGRRDITGTGNLDYVQKQVETARNVGSSWKPLDALIHFLFGGLNRQIEHHLWPYMPRCNLKRAEMIVREYCAAADIRHHHTTLLQAYREVFSHLASIGASLRKHDRAMG